MKSRALASLGSLALAVAAAASVTAAPAMAKVAESNDRGFVIRHVAVVPASVDATWDLLLKPAKWWDSRHTWSADPANLSLDARAGGCFCEVLPNAGSPKAAPRGGVEHMRVVYIERPRALRMTGALGPLQSDAVIGTLTIQLKPDPADEAKTQILLEYVVGGYLRTPSAKMAAAVDGVLGEQLSHLAKGLGGAFEQAFSLPAIAGEGEVEAPAEAPVPGVEPLGEAPVQAAEGEYVGR